jgi:hypothetical protein
MPVRIKAGGGMSETASEWGRIDAEGTVFVRTADGERPIGSWQAGDAEAGLAYYRRKYDDLATEVDLLERRLQSGAGDPAATKASATELRGTLGSAAVIGDLGALDERLARIVAEADQKAEERAAARQQARAEAVAAKEALVTEAETIAAESTSWKAAGDRLRAMVDEWKVIKGVDRRTDEALWKRFSAARDAFGRRRGQYFAQLDAERTSAREVKEKLVARAEELSTSSDWRDTAAKMRELMAEWKSAGRAARDAEDALWARFRAAQDAFFTRRSATFAERDAELGENLRRKQEIVREAEQLELGDPKAAQSALRELQSRFDAVGHVPREAMRGIEERMRSAEQRVREAVDAAWRTSSAASNPFLTALQERLAEAEQRLERARKSGDPDRIARAEAEVAQRRSLLPH